MQGYSYSHDTISRLGHDLAPMKSWARRRHEILIAHDFVQKYTISRGCAICEDAMTCTRYVARRCDAESLNLSRFVRQYSSIPHPWPRGSPCCSHRPPDGSSRGLIARRHRLCVRLSPRERAATLSTSTVVTLNTVAGPIHPAAAGAAGAWSSSTSCSSCCQ